MNMQKKINDKQTCLADRHDDHPVEGETTRAATTLAGDGKSDADMVMKAPAIAGLAQMPAGEQLDPELQQAHYEYLVHEAVVDAKFRADLHDDVGDDSGEPSFASPCTKWLRQLKVREGFQKRVDTNYGFTAALFADDDEVWFSLAGRTWWPSHFASEACHRIFDYAPIKTYYGSRCPWSGLYDWQLEVPTYAEHFYGEYRDDDDMWPLAHPEMWVLAHWLEACERVPPPRRSVLPLPGLAELERLRVRGEHTQRDQAERELASPIWGEFPYVREGIACFGEGPAFQIRTRVVRGEVVLNLLGHRSLYSGSEAGATDHVPRCGGDASRGRHAAPRYVPQA